MKKVLLFSALLLTSAFTAFAGHVDTYGIGSKATSMGGAVVAGIDDPFAVYYNPAAMSNIKQPMLSVGTHLVDPHLTIKSYNVENSGLLADGDFGANGIKDEAELLIVPHIGYVHPINDKLTLGVAFYVPYGLDLKWNPNENENPAAYNTFHSWYLREVVTPSLSYKVNDNLSLGAGISVGKAKAGNERKRYVPEKMKNPQYMAAVAQANGIPAQQAAAAGAALAAAYTELDGAHIKMEYADDFNWSYNLGALYKFNDKVSAGITYRSYSNIEFEGDASARPEMQYWKNEQLGSDTAVDTPDTIQFGVEYKVTPKLKVEADIVRTFWSRVDSYTVNINNYLLQSEIAPTLIPGANVEYFKRDWKDTWQYRLGTEYKLNDKVDLRAGYYYDPTVVPEETFDVLWPDSDKHVFSGGVGLHFGKVDVDAVVQYILIKEVTINSGASSHNLDDSYSRPNMHEADVSATAGGHIWSFGVTVSYKF